MLSSALTSGVGLLYWVLVARLFPPEVVGVNSVALSTMMLLGGTAHFNMTYALLRFVPVAGRAARRLVVGGYLVTTVAAALAGGAFALGAELWAPQLVDAVGHTQLVVFFMLATPTWAIFVVQDFVLTAIRRATVVPLENFVFSLLKIGLLVAASLAAVQGGIAISWVVATFLIVFGVNLWLLLRAVPRFGRTHEDKAVPITLGAITRFVRADYAGAVCWQAVMFGLPVLVLARLGAEEAAAYGIVWQIAQALYLVSSGMGQSMVAHNATDPGGLEGARRAMVTKALTLIIPVVAVLVVGGPLILSVFGEHYAEFGAGALALAALSSVPNVITASTVSAARVRQRMGVLFAVPASIAMIVIVLSWLLMPHLGITAVGLSWLIGQCVVAGCIVVATAPWIPGLLGTRIDAVRSAALLRRVGPAAVRGAGVDDPDSWVLRERLVGRSDSVVVGIGPEDGPGALLKAADSAKGQVQLRRQTEMLAAMHADQRIGAWRSLIPTIVGAGDIGGSYCVMESRMSGEGGGQALRDPARRRFFLSSSIATISELHRLTATPVRAGDVELERWVHAPMAMVRDALPRSQHAAAVMLENELADRVRGRVIAAAWTHGDFTPDNVLTDVDGRVTAVVDWCHADAHGLAVLDIVCLLLTAENLVEGTELGTLVLRRLAEALPAEHHLLARAQRMLGGEVLDVGLLTLLGWLQHVNHNLGKSPTFAANPVWMRRNVIAVVRGAAFRNPGGAAVDRPTAAHEGFLLT